MIYLVFFFIFIYYDKTPNVHLFGSVLPNELYFQIELAVTSSFIALVSLSTISLWRRNRDENSCTMQMSINISVY